MHGCYRSRSGHSKLVHHAVCADRSIIVRLMNYCHAILAIILLSPSVSGIVHSVKIIYFLKFITL